MEEFEIKFLEINMPELEKKLLQIGAERVDEYNYFVVLFDYPDWRLDKDNSWLKLRTDGKETTLSYKQRIGVKTDDNLKDDGMTEIEITVSDYEKTYELLKSLGFVIKREMEKRRVRYKKDNVVFDIDFWPKIPPFVEVEADSMENAKNAAILAGFDPEDGLICSASAVYAKYGINPDEYSSMTFKEFVKK